MIKNTVYDLCVGIAQDAGKFINRHVGTTHSPIKALVLAPDHMSNSAAVQAKRFAIQNAPNVRIGIIDADGFRSFAGHGLESQNAARSEDRAVFPSLRGHLQSEYVFLASALCNQVRLTIRDFGCRSKRQPAWRKISASRRSNSADLPSERL